MNHYHKIIEYLSRCSKNDVISHAYIFYGPDEEAKKTAALNFSGELLGANAKFHPDLMIISSDADEERSINAVRQLKKFLNLTSYYGKRKIAIIEAAEKLNYYAQNALLKLLEEAPDKSVVILLAKTTDSVAETIVSRCVKLSFWRQVGRNPVKDKKETNILILNEILNGDFKDRYRNMEKLKDLKAAEAFKMWVEFLRTEFLAGRNELAEILKTSQNIYFKLNETNMNSKLAYDELILNLWKS